MLTFEQFLETRIYVARGKGQVTAEVKAVMMRLIDQGITSVKEIHSKVVGEGFAVTYAALYPYIRKELDKKRTERYVAWERDRERPTPKPPQEDPYLRKQLDEPSRFYDYRPDEDEDDGTELPSPFFGFGTGGGVRINRSSKIYS